MRVAILGASGQTGKHLIDQALEKGHDVIAIARSPEKILFDSPKVTKRAGDAFDEQSVAAALEGADAVITTVGKTNLRDKRTNLSTAAHRGVFLGMREHDIKRLLVISSVGAAQNVKRKGLRRKLYLYFRRDYYRDMFEMEQEVAASGLDYTLLRAPLLHDGPRTGSWRVLETEDYLQLLKISRADIAGFLIEQLDDNKWVNRTIAISEQ